MRLLPRWLRRKPPVPRIRVETFAHRHPDLFLSKTASFVEGRNLVSQLCRYDTLVSQSFRKWLDQLGEAPELHRKRWELAYICQALAERGLLTTGTRGLGFAIGAEKLPAFFAARGCQITATDLASEDERNEAWAKTGQWLGNAAALNRDGLCPADAFAERVQYRSVDMNEIPEDLTNFDFTWSTCSFEHCGSLELGLAFLERQMDCLRPGGLAVHTTEFNLTSNTDTVEQGSYVIYRLCDIEAICERLRQSGHKVAPLDLFPGTQELDRYVDMPPYYQSAKEPHGRVKHLRLALNGFAATSIGLIIEKAR